MTAGTYTIQGVTDSTLTLVNVQRTPPGRRPARSPISVTVTSQGAFRFGETFDASQVNHRQRHHHLHEPGRLPDRRRRPDRHPGQPGPRRPRARRRTTSARSTPPRSSSSRRSPRPSPSRRGHAGRHTTARRAHSTSPACRGVPERDDHPRHLQRPEPDDVLRART